MHDWPRDTSPEALRVQHEILRGMTFAQKMSMVDGLWDLLRSSSVARLRERHPGATRDEIDEMFVRERAGPVLADAVIAARRQRLHRR